MYCTDGGAVVRGLGQQRLALAVRHGGGQLVAGAEREPATA